MTHSSPTAAAASKAAAPTDKTTDQGRLLVVDDNEMNRDMLSRRLGRRGFEVEVAVDGRQALESIAARDYDLVLLDIAMPELDGLTVLKKVRATRHLSDLPIVMATAHDRSEDIVRALELGANDYVTKPLDFPVVLARVRTQLALKRATQAVQAANLRMKRDLAAAAKVQQTLIPKTPPAIQGASFAWIYEPCDELAGDTLDVFQIDDRRAGLYLVDVSGHGVPAALLAVTLSRVLSHLEEDSLVVHDKARPGATLVPPAEVAAKLNQRFPMDPDTKQYFTLLYGVLDLERQELRYTCGGHPAPVYVPHQGNPCLREAGGLPIGCFEGAAFEECSIALKRGDRVYFYSDGVIEAQSPSAELFSAERLLAALERSRALPLGDALDALREEIRSWRAGEAADDDLSLLALEIA